MAKMNYYELLEIGPAATQDEIEEAKRAALYRYHPDHNPDRGDWAHERTSEVLEAYDVLSNPLRRKIYNFFIFATIRTSPPELKFNIFQGADKKKYEEACEKFMDAVADYDEKKKGDQLREVLTRFQLAFSIYPMAETSYNIGILHAKLNKLQEASHAFKKASELDPDNQHYRRTSEKLAELAGEIERARNSNNG
ncbi:MAG: DnaJ domain-containing protein [Spirochaetia bacterium]|nr:DnaJ domain-containing protein [Spirochaetia bacterium]